MFIFAIFAIYQKRFAMKKYLRKKAYAKWSALLPKGEVYPNSMLILFDCSMPEHEKIVTTWVKKHREVFSKTAFIGLDPKNSNPQATVFPILGKKDFTWYGSLKKDAVSRVLPDFLPDFLMVLHKKSSIAIDYLAKALPASFKITHNPALPSSYNIILDDSRHDWSVVLKEFDTLMPKVEFVS